MIPKHSLADDLTGPAQRAVQNHTCSHPFLAPPLLGKTTILYEKLAWFKAGLHFFDSPCPLRTRQLLVSYPLRTKNDAVGSRKSVTLYPRRMNHTEKLPDFAYRWS